MWLKNIGSWYGELVIVNIRTGELLFTAGGLDVCNGLRIRSSEL